MVLTVPERHRQPDRGQILMSGDGLWMLVVRCCYKSGKLSASLLLLPSESISSNSEILQYLHNGGLIFKKSNISGNKPAATKGFAVIPNNNTVCL